jgi:hypothetical protein
MENKNQTIENPTSGKLSESEAIVATLELVWEQLGKCDDLNSIKSEVASDLLIARIALDFEKTGQLDKKQIKKYIDEIY